jgi:hypothetical protein
MRLATEGLAAVSLMCLVVPLAAKIYLIETEGRGAVSIFVIKKNQRESIALAEIDMT